MFKHGKKQGIDNISYEQRNDITKRKAGGVLGREAATWLADFSNIISLLFWRVKYLGEKLGTMRLDGFMFDNQQHCFSEMSAIVS